MGKLSGDEAYPFNADERTEGRPEAGSAPTRSHVGREPERLHVTESCSKAGSCEHAGDGSVMKSLSRDFEVRRFWMACNFLNLRAGDGDRTRDVQLGKSDVD